MPTYEYECEGCHRVFELRQRISEPPLSLCDQCGGPVRRLLAPAHFILKGGGWYVTDYPSEARKQAMKAESSADGAKSSTGGSESPKPSTSTESPGAATSSAPSPTSS